MRLERWGNNLIPAMLRVMRHGLWQIAGGRAVSGHDLFPV